MDERTPGDIVEELARLENEGIGPLFSIYAEGGLDELLRSGNPDDLSEGWWARAPDRFGELAFLTLARLSPARVVQHVAARCPAEAPLDRRIAGLRLLGELGSARGLATTFKIATELNANELRYRTVGVALGTTLTAILRNDSDAVEEVRVFLPELQGPLMAFTLEALGASGRGAAMDILLDLLGENEGLDVFVLEQVGALGESVPWRIGTDPRGRIRLLLHDEEWRVRRSAAACLGRLNANEAAWELVDLLDDPSPRVARAAQWALGGLAGERVERSKDEWTVWLDREEDRWEEQRDATRLHLAELDAGEAVRVLRGLSFCSLHRREAGQIVVEALDHDEPQVVAAAAGTLQRLGSLEALPDLVAALRAPDELARQAVWECLRALTGEDRPLDPVSWTAFLDIG